MVDFKDGFRPHEEEGRFLDTGEMFLEAVGPGGVLHIAVVQIYSGHPLQPEIIDADGDEDSDFPQGFVIADPELYLKLFQLGPLPESEELGEEDSV